MTFVYVTYYVISFYIQKTADLIGTKIVLEEKVIEMIELMAISTLFKNPYLLPDNLRPFFSTTKKLR